MSTTDRWLKLNFASCVTRKTRSLGALVLCSICNMVVVNYIYDMAVDTQFHKFHGRPIARVLYLFERSEFLVDTVHPKRKVCACARVPVCRVHVSNNLGLSVWYYVPHTYVLGISSLSAGYQDTYMYLRMCQGGVRIMCHICT